MEAALDASEEEVALRADFVKPDTELAMVVTVLAERPKSMEEEFARPPAQVAEQQWHQPRAREVVEVSPTRAASAALKEEAGPRRQGTASGGAS